MHDLNSKTTSPPTCGEEQIASTTLTPTGELNLRINKEDVNNRSSTPLPPLSSILKNTTTSSSTYGCSSNINTCTTHSPLPLKQFPWSSSSASSASKLLSAAVPFTEKVTDHNNDDLHQAECFVPVDTHHFSEKDFKDHRERCYPHMHQPLKSMEPRALSRIRSRIAAAKRAAKRAASAGKPSTVRQLLTTSNVPHKAIVTGSGELILPQDIAAAGVSSTAIFSPIDNNSGLDIPNPTDTPTHRHHHHHSRRRRKHHHKRESFKPTLNLVSEESSNSKSSSVSSLQFLADETDHHHHHQHRRDGENDEDEEDDNDDDSDSSLSNIESDDDVLPNESTNVIDSTTSISTSPTAADPIYFTAADNVISLSSSNVRIPSFYSQLSSDVPPISFLTSINYTGSLPIVHDEDHLLFVKSNNRRVISTNIFDSNELESSSSSTAALLPLAPTTTSRSACDNNRCFIRKVSFASELSTLPDGTATSSAINNAADNNALPSSLDIVGGATGAGVGAIDEHHCREGGNTMDDDGARRLSFSLGGETLVAASVSSNKTRFINQQQLLQHDEDASILLSSCSTSSSSSSSHNHHHQHHHHQYHHPKERFGPRDLQQRQFTGRELRNILPETPPHVLLLHHNENNEEEIKNQQQNLKPFDFDNIYSHRTQELPGLRRHKIQPSAYETNRLRKVQRSNSFDSHLSQHRNSEDKMFLGSGGGGGAAGGGVGYNHHRMNTTATVSRENFAMEWETDVRDIPPYLRHHAVSHTPKPVFVEMDKLVYESRHRAWHWQEVARWVHQEEDLDLDTNSFGTAHAPVLSFEAIIRLEKHLSQGLVSLDKIVARDLVELIDFLVAELSIHGQCSPQERLGLRDAMLLYHQHVGEKYTKREVKTLDSAMSTTSMRNLLGDGTTTSTSSYPIDNHYGGTAIETEPHRCFTSPHMDNHDVVVGGGGTATTTRPPSQMGKWATRLEEKMSPTVSDHGGSGEILNATTITLAEKDKHGHPTTTDGYGSGGGGGHKTTAWPPHLPGHHFESRLRDRLPVNTEAVTVQVGVVRHLRKPICAFIRLPNALFADGVTELHRVPIRFLFIFLVPPDYPVDPTEVGRCFAVMMIDPAFRRLAFEARYPEDLIMGVSQFLSKSVVLPLSKYITKDSLGAMFHQIKIFRRQFDTREGNDKRNKRAILTSLPQQSTGAIGATAAAAAASQSTAANAPSSNEDLSYLIGKPFVPSNYKRNDEWDAIVNNDDVENNDHTLLTVPLASTAPAYLDRFANFTREGGRAGGGGGGGGGSGVNPMDMDSDGKGISRRIRTNIDNRNKCCRRWKPFESLLNDWRGLKNRYVSDFVDAFKPWSSLIIVILGTFFVYFTALAPAITFGALLNRQVNQEVTVALSIVSAGAFQTMFALFSGQPLTIVGHTGPLFIVESSIRSFSSSLSVATSTLRLWTVFYTALLTLTVLSLNGVRLVTYLRNSTMDIFNAFIALFYILKALFTMLKEIPRELPLKPLDLANCSTSSSYNSKYKNAGGGGGGYSQLACFHDWLALGQITAGALIALIMLVICLCLVEIKRGRFLRRRARILLGSLNVPIGIFVVSNLSMTLLQVYHLPTLQVPSKIDATMWIKTPNFTEIFHSNVMFNAQFHGYALLTAICLCVVVLTETSMTSATLAAPERRMNKIPLFSQDLLLCGVLFPLISGFLGWPFVSAALVRANSHAIAMTKWDYKTPPGVPHRVIGCVEQRISGLMVGLLVLISITLAPVLRYIPLHAMYGMFLYMGVMGIRDLLLKHRLVALLKRKRHWHDRDYLRGMPRVALATFTLICWTFCMAMVGLNVMAEFIPRAAWVALLAPLILLVYQIVRDCFLPRFDALAPYLEAMDKRPTVMFHPAVVSNNNKKKAIDFVRQESVASSVKFSIGDTTTGNEHHQHYHHSPPKDGMEFLWNTAGAADDDVGGGGVGGGGSGGLRRASVTAAVDLVYMRNGVELVRRPSEHRIWSCSMGSLLTSSHNSSESLVTEFDESRGLENPFPHA